MMSVAPGPAARIAGNHDPTRAGPARPDSDSVRHAPELSQCDRDRRYGPGGTVTHPDSVLVLSHGGHGCPSHTYGTAGPSEYVTVVVTHTGPSS